jgi:hypothetical protein
VALATALLYGCATAGPPTVKDGCAVNLKKVCQYILDNEMDHLVSDDGVALNRQRLENLSVPPVEVLARSRGAGAPSAALSILRPCEPPTHIFLMDRN